MDRCLISVNDISTSICSYLASSIAAQTNIRLACMHRKELANYIMLYYYSRFIPSYLKCSEHHSNGVKDFTQSGMASIVSL